MGRSRLPVEPPPRVETWVEVPIPVGARVLAQLISPLGHLIRRKRIRCSIGWHSWQRVRNDDGQWHEKCLACGTFVDVGAPAPPPLGPPAP